MVISSRDHLRRQVESLADIYLPVVVETLLALLEELSEVDKQALNTLTLVPSLFQTSDIQPFLDAIAALQKNVATPASDAAIAEYRVEIEQLVGARCASLSHHANTLDRALINLRAIEFSHFAHLISPLTEDVQSTQLKLEAEQALLTALTEQYAVANTLVAEVESLSFYDKLKPLVTSLEKLAEVDPQSPLVGSIQAGITGVSNMLNLLDGALSYEQLLGYRDKVAAQMTESRDKTAEIARQSGSSARKLEQLSALGVIDTSKAEYMSEIGKLVEALNRFLELNGRTGSETIEVRVSRFAHQGRLLANQLNELRREWRN
ncbi:alpha-xenorhabdolysin family binary toxin subunit B [Pseudomonas sp. CDFA 602]|uniref:alpha-xenorhabdolysin family binary toxin subunit B n=1 Tax=Pseudomonas californiensis TaxID=2829823 RepID=UPI001E2AE8AC|nr:alpha-xenorhabdolysin family binary toxin subunit B [Pseudomonas californiensis]MCD5997250.1 alpha-xenorhabdolysin family binary toxin subunit B [Pseudomonas californiensis]MCD6002831.1 alpha-xenorhabdolysin family binary toxin subunit B [Pseudomonas californiensis]